MLTFSYAPGAQNFSSISKGGLDKGPTFCVDWAAGMPGGSTLSTTTASAVDEANVSATSTVINTTSNSGAVTTVELKTAGASGTGAATNGARFRIRLLQTLSNADVLLYDIFLIVDNPTYDPI